MSFLSDYNFYILDSKNVGLFPREKFIFKSLKSKNIRVKNIYSLVPFKYWTNKSFLSFRYFIKYITHAFIGKNYLDYLIKRRLFNQGFKEKEYRKITHIIHTSLVDSTNKANNSLLTKGLNSFFISNIKWRLRYSFFAASLCAIVDKLGKKILHLSNTCIVFGDKSYCHETLITIFLLFENKSRERNNNLLFFSGVFSDSLYHAINIDQLKDSNGPYGSKDSLEIHHNASLKDEKLVSNDRRNLIFKNFVLYPPCISDTYYFTEPLVYESQYEWANDLFEIHSNKDIFIKMHPSASDYNDLNYWYKLFKSLGLKYRVKVNYLDVNFKIDDVIDLGFFPLSPRNTAPLELLQRGIPALFLDSNTWTCNFPRLKIDNKKKYKKVIINSLKNQDINFYLKDFKPSKFEINLAKSIYEHDKKEFFSSLGIEFENLPKVSFGQKHRYGKKNYIKDQEMEKIYIKKITTKESCNFFIKNLEEYFLKISN